VIAALDVQYADERAAAAGLVFADWTDAAPVAERVVQVAEPAAYVSGEFWRRELPCLMQVLAALPGRPDVVVIDGYVWLDGQGRRGLGAHLHEALGGTVAVIGVAKSAFQGSPHAVPVVRGESTRPLFVTAQGLVPTDAAAAVARMHGPFRVPTLLRRADQLCRAGLVATG
jgi:deoxyribonuclease V